MSEGRGCLAHVILAAELLTTKAQRSVLRALVLGIGDWGCGGAAGVTSFRNTVQLQKMYCEDS